MSLAHTNGIQNWNNFNVRLDFKNLRFGKENNKRPSDIDMFYIQKNILIIADGKNERGELHSGQRWVYESLINGWDKGYKNKGFFILFKHDSYQQNGDTTVDVADCEIDEYFFAGKWHLPKVPTIMLQAMKKILGEDYKPVVTYEYKYEEPLDLESINF